MTTSFPIEVPLSGKVLGTLIKGWQVGQEALALILVGTISILAAFALALHGTDLVAVAFLAVGAALVGFVAWSFYIRVMLPARKASEAVRHNAPRLRGRQAALLSVARTRAGARDIGDVSAGLARHGIVHDLPQAREHEDAAVQDP